MRRSVLCFFAFCISVSILTVPRSFAGPESDETKEFAGLWEAKRNFGPEVRGILTLTRRKDGSWIADIAGRSASANVEKQKISFQLPGDAGSFLGKIDMNEIKGHWIQPRTITSGGCFSSPVKLTQEGKDLWRAEVIPLEDEFTFYLPVRSKEDGTLGAFLRNPDRNLGVFLNADRLEHHGDTVQLIGRFLRNKEEVTLADGIYHKDEGRISLYFAGRGGTYDFTRSKDDSASNFYARGRMPEPYHYEPPLAEDDGWEVGTLDEVGLSVEPIKKLIEKVIEVPADSVNSPYVHGLLIARHNKLVLEEYFHGFHRDKPHDTRSASKSLTSVLIGAAIQKGLSIKASSFVYDVIYGQNLPPNLDPRKRKMTVENLLTMSSGLDCDDDDPKSLGNEEILQENENGKYNVADWYNYTLALPMVSEPGKKTAYCSASPNLAGDALSSASGRPLQELFQDLIAEPLQIHSYYLGLQPTGQPYMGGGIHWMPRDFMKLGQVLLNDGTWNGKRILSKEWARRSIAPVVQLRNKDYGYLWWLIDYPYKDRTVRAFYAGGNGGQVVMGIPELDLLIAFYAGNYQDRVGYKIQEDFVPNYILPALKSE